MRARHWRLQQEAGIDVIPSNDFSFYDHILDTAAMLGAVPPRFRHAGGNVGAETYFAMARGNDDAPAMEMTKWFDTNYHYIVRNSMKTSHSPSSRPRPSTSSTRHERWVS